MPAQPRIIIASDCIETEPFLDFYQALPGAEIVALQPQSELGLGLERINTGRQDVIIAALSDLRRLQGLRTFHSAILLFLLPHVTSEKAVGNALHYAKKRKMRLAVCHSLRFQPGIARLKEIIDSSVLGNVQQVRVTVDTARFWPELQLSPPDLQAFNLYHGADLALWIGGCAADAFDAVNISAAADSTLLVLKLGDRFSIELTILSNSGQQGKRKGECAVEVVADNGELEYRGRLDTHNDENLKNHHFIRTVRFETTQHTRVINVPSAQPVALEAASVMRNALPLKMDPTTISTEQRLVALTQCLTSTLLQTADQ